MHIENAFALTLKIRLNQELQRLSFAWHELWLIASGGAWQRTRSGEGKEGLLCWGGLLSRGSGEW